MPPAKRPKTAAEGERPTRASTRSSARLRNKAAETSSSNHTGPSPPIQPTKKAASRKAATKSPTKTPKNGVKKDDADGAGPVIPAKPSNLWVNEDCLHEICSYLGPGDISKALTINSAFYNAATPHLYRVLKQRAGCDCIGLYDRNIELVSKYTTAIEFFPHSHRTHLPRLDTGRITTHIVNYDWNNKSTDQDLHGRTAAWGTYKCPQCPKAPAPPKRLILRPGCTVADFIKKGDRKSKRVMIPLGTKCTDKIVHISLNMGKSAFSTGRYGAKPKPITPTKKLTFVILPAFWDCGPIILEQRRPMLLRSLSESLASHVIKLHDHSIRIVGLEVRDPFAPESEWYLHEVRQAVARTQFRNELERQFGCWPISTAWSAEDKDRVRNKVTFQTLRDYLEHGDWGEELGQELVGRWLNALDARENGRMITPALPGAKRGKTAPKKATTKRNRRKRKYESDTEPEAELSSEEEIEDFKLRNEDKAPNMEAMKVESEEEEDEEEEDY
ncbi:hypothetical protein CspHIS471_0300900 [Cutaneotrichosporon sp. HIS471]|nr:hypothetical protein CspHIS471_0300900 [Cutaneotrichosporon sp. HIS471]